MRILINALTSFLPKVVQFCSVANEVEQAHLVGKKEKIWKDNHSIQ